MKKILGKIGSFFRYLYSAPQMPKKPKSKLLRILLLVCGWGVFALLPVYCLGMTEYIHFASKAAVFEFFRTRIPVMLFDLALLYILWFCALCIFKKGWIASLVYGGVFAAVSYVDYLKYAMTGDYFYPWDLVQQTGNVGELLHFITVPFPILYTIMYILLLGWAAFLFFSGAQLPVRWFVRFPALLAVVLVTALSVSTPKKVQNLLNKNDLYLENMALQTSNYQANGFIGAFCVNALSANIQKPETYGEDTIAALMDGREDSDAAADFSSPDIILVLSESFWDPTLLPGTVFSEDPLANYRALCEKEGSISGRFFTTGYGGGTVRPEFEVLTGLSTDYLPSGCVPWQYINEPSDSYVSVYHDLGYTTMAVHPYTSSFYCRKDAYPLIGIDTLHFEDELYALGDTLGLTVSGRQISDDTFCSAIEYYLEQNTDAPVFLFGISMENHQPYPGKFDVFPVTAENPAFDASVADAVSNFTMGVYEADQCLGRLASYIDSRDRDTILVWFGDHLPTLGAGNGAYVQSGMIGTYGEEDYERLYATPFLVYANFPLGESTMLHAGADNDITSYNLMNAVAQLIGAPRTRLMDYLEDYYAAIPYYNVRLHKAISEEAAEFVEGHKLLTYDLIAGEKYALQ